MTNRRKTKLDNHPYSRLVVYGCSFTAGTELADHEYIGKSPKWSDQFKIARGFSEWTEFLTKTIGTEKYNELIETCKQRSWAGHLANHLSVPCVNRAIGGCSLEEMLYLYYQDKINNFLCNSDLVIFGLTSPGRFMYLDEKFGEPQRCLLGFQQALAWRSKKYYKSYINLMGNDNTTLWQYFNSLQHLNMLCNANRNTYMQHILNTYSYHKNWYSTNASDNVLELLDYMIPQSIDDQSLFEFVELDRLKDLTHGGGHLYESVHIKFSAHLYEKIISMHGD